MFGFVDAGATAALALVLLATFRYELGFPLRVGVLVVPPITLIGFGSALAVQHYTGLRGFQSVGVLAAFLFLLVVVFELLPSHLKRPNYASRYDR